MIREFYDDYGSNNIKPENAWINRDIFKMYKIPKDYFSKILKIFHI